MTPNQIARVAAHAKALESLAAREPVGSKHHLTLAADLRAMLADIPTRAPGHESPRLLGRAIRWLIGFAGFVAVYAAWTEATFEVDRILLIGLPWFVGAGVILHGFWRFLRAFPGDISAIWHEQDARIDKEAREPVPPVPTTRSE